MTDRDPSPAAGVAIIGIAVRFPGAAGLDAFWANLAGGVESIRFLDDEELRAAGVPAALLADPRYVRAKGVLDGADLFDADLFGFTPREAEIMDPQHRILLECAWEALEHAGHGAAAGRVAVYAGANLNTYLISNLLPNRELVERVGTLQTVLLNNNDFLATRISYELDLKGPSVLVQTACSTALVAVHMACQSLLGGECDMALAGGVSISVPQRAGYLYQEGGVMSPDGHCRAFDARAAGSVEGEGAGLVVLKRLADALEDGDTIHAVIRGSATNNDGAGKVGFTAPSVLGQAEVIAESLAMAGVDPGTIGYVEAHGSGTPLGDPIEIEALTHAFRAGAAGAAASAHRGTCAVGSVKTNVGHLNSAAGIAGLVKAVLALEHGAIPPSLGFERPNPQIDLAASPFYVPAALTPWPRSARGEEPRRAGVSSFGLGGTNVHAILEEAPAAEPSGPARPWQLLPLSARTPAALDAATANLGDHLAARLDLGERDLAPERSPVDLVDCGETERSVQERDLADIAYTLATGRRAFTHRRAVVCRGREEAVALLSGADPARLLGSGAAIPGRPVAFLFPGLGDHYVDMGRGLYDAEPLFRREVDRCAELLTPLLGEDVRVAIFAGPEAKAVAGAAPVEPDMRSLLRRGRREGPEGPESPADAAADPAMQNLSRTLLAQPALFVVEYALARLLASWGVRPAAMIGYSIGEYVAACLAGVLTLEGALTLVAGRARLIAELPPGAMLAIPLAEERVRPLIEEIAATVETPEISGVRGGGLSLAAVNGPHFSVAAGTAEAIDELERRLGAGGGGGACLRLHATHAFHSSEMAPAVEPLLRLARSVPLAPPRIPYLSNVTGDWITDAEATDPAYWGRHMAGTVRFAGGLARLLAQPERALLEVGPGDTLGTLVRQHPDADPRQPVVPTMRRAGEGRPDLAVLLEAAGRLWTAGAELDAEALFRPGGARRRRVPLPAYPFERRRYWIDPPVSSAATGASGIGGTALALGTGPLEPGVDPRAIPEPGNRPDLADWFYLPAWRETPPPGGGRRPALAAGGRWLVFLDGLGIGRRLATRLQEEGQGVATIVPGERFRDLGEGFFALPPASREGYAALLAELRARGGEPTGAIHLWSVGPEAASFAAAQELGLLSLLRLGEALGAHAGATISLLAVSSGAQAVLEGDALDPARATLLGAAKVIPQELPRIACRAIDVVAPEAGSAEEGRLVERLLAELAVAPGPGEPAVALRGRRRFARAWEPMPLAPLLEPSAANAAVTPSAAVAVPAPSAAIGASEVGAATTSSTATATGAPGTRNAGTAEPARLRPGGAYLVTVAEHGVGPALAQGLRGTLGARLALVAPPGPALDPRLTALARDGGEDVLLLSADLSSAGEMRDALARARERFGALDGVIHAADTFSGGLIQLKTRETLTAVFGPQVQGALALDAALRSAPEPAAGFLLLAGSTATATGGFGQVDHAAAGAVLGALAERAAVDGGVFTVAVDWDPYQWGSWLAGGLTGALVPGMEENLARFEVPPARSLEALGRLLEADLPRVVVSAQDLAAAIAETDAVHAKEILAGMSHAPAGSHARPEGPYVAPAGETERALALIWGELFGIEGVGAEDNFLALGGHSLLAIQLVTQVRDILGVDLPVSALFEHPTVAGLARVVEAERGEAAAAEEEELDELLAEVEGLSPEEVARLLEQERAAAGTVEAGT